MLSALIDLGYWSLVNGTGGYGAKDIARLDRELVDEKRT
jgi:hypothetical protein